MSRFKSAHSHYKCFAELEILEASNSILKADAYLKTFKEICKDPKNELRISSEESLKNILTLIEETKTRLEECSIDLHYLEGKRIIKKED